LEQGTSSGAILRGSGSTNRSTGNPDESSVRAAGSGSAPVVMADSIEHLLSASVERTHLGAWIIERCEHRNVGHTQADAAERSGSQSRPTSTRRVWTTLENWSVPTLEK
jgi:hypothetical protein